MLLEKTAPSSIQDRLEPLADGRFRFACHPEVPCFTECCRDLRLQLTPYDIVRMKNRLGMTSGAFLEEYAEIRPEGRGGMPMAYLRMLDNERKTCPFVSHLGCGIYEGRPSACRIYPVARASRMHGARGAVQAHYYLLREEHCRGFFEAREWRIEDWITDQGLGPYHEMNNLWMEIITHPNIRRAQGFTLGQTQVFYLAAYDLDRFRSFVLGGRFLQTFELSDEEIEGIRKTDEGLLRLAFRWLSFTFLKKPALQMR
ncbi:MAG: YkgJ family cysteine cluster protein [Syntrophobacteraceae bacterium]|nr:YkgJ family cysteine cluster protein [Syntrophobacteraceae bacterium]